MRMYDASTFLLRSEHQHAAVHFLSLRTLNAWKEEEIFMKIRLIARILMHVV